MGPHPRDFPPAYGLEWVHTHRKGCPNRLEWVNTHETFLPNPSYVGVCVCQCVCVCVCVSHRAGMRLPTVFFLKKRSFFWWRLGHLCLQPAVFPPHLQGLPMVRHLGFSFPSTTTFLPQQLSFCVFPNEFKNAFRLCLHMFGHGKQ